MREVGTIISMVVLASLIAYIFVEKVIIAQPLSAATQRAFFAVTCPGAVLGLGLYLLG
jgi:hypothetical protein